MASGLRPSPSRVLTTTIPSYPPSPVTVLRGTEMYQCPEMLMGSPTCSQASDAWSLGCMLYELLTQAPLFPGKSECLRPILVGGKGAIPASSWCECECTGPIGYFQFSPDSQI